ncbi:MAG TPA: ATP-binding cassette domain-containing protein [Microbacteriaceae bacterium]|nr:ATP-binding cassette domain-containing protein [Microbacteriaceae bacterium]
MSRGGARAIQTEGLTKRFGRHVAVDGVGLDVPHGSVFGFLGPNGAGKTTTIRMLLGLVGAAGGRIELLGRRMPDEAATVLPRVGAMVEGPGFSPYLSGTANLLRMDSADPRANWRDRKTRAAKALEKVGLGHAAQKKVHNYSLGMRSRLGLALTLLRPHDLLVLDEPTNGLDPQGTREVRGIITGLAASGTTVFLSSHLLSEVEQMCSHAAVLRSGRLVAQGSLSELGARSRVVDVETRDPNIVASLLASLGLHPQAAGGTAGTHVTADLPQESLEPEEMLTRLVQAGARIGGFAVRGSSLEERYVALTGEGFDVDG